MQAIAQRMVHEAAACFVLVLAVAATSMTGCGTYMSRAYDWGMDYSGIYGGTRFDAGVVYCAIRHPGRFYNVPEYYGRPYLPPLAAMDAPLSLALDTALLPLTAVEQIALTPSLSPFGCEQW